MPMIHRLLPPLLFAAFAVAAGAAEGDLERAAALRGDAKTLRDQADDTLRAAEPGCYERFLVNRCLANAKAARLESIRKARELEAEAGRLEVAERQRLAQERGLTAPAAAPAPAAPTEPKPIAPSAAPSKGAPTGADAAPVDPEAIRRERQIEAERAAEAARAERRALDAEKAREREKAAADAAERAEKARRDRERYDERIREREAEKAEEARKASQ
ncbi:MAG: hypothetical protein ROZ37_20655 [Aromatoleum sp.]|uniref:hypothetical protein n=1 Tax=Aromatoleum sp. TaxID=2307007 RepID=UPI002894D90C|nr:hypothetical protein [Aromatoleum sp.]MDT3672736.1 hypothetical protein [Aromatoleum sp.]